MLEVVAETGSTNADLLARVAAGEMVREGDWLLADRQKAGRGRQGREWFDSRGNFMGSTVVRLLPTDPAAHSLSLMAGLALHEAVAPLCPPHIPTTLKWPNDVLLGGAKLAGILLERTGDVIVVGIGVNLAAAPALPDRETVALSAFGPAPDRDAFAATLAEAFAQELGRWRNYGLDPQIRRWLAVGTPIGQRITVHDPSGDRLTGQFAGLDSDGTLMMRLDDGRERAIHAGDVILA
ncbi:biotin--[acetyl-CoA-carboxylase] ligase [Erythrobacter sp. 3-20A1M]|uniref:biotin--[acetyl-CoA-carboxylase] ligase n=1 Tax=Erythrobacter sp. 3-20A1M TaxID=2653850 RepID=UPI001BFCAD5B|nr:biotin--[acetyl-CoA-carboxylase] ligase [Erythrobacter sp. 3-20A1M]QWC58077.1 biotin--[acetyl-CoA-carboxylase] ligase [Erythrobacter sp. 3-20A1M]